MAPGNTSAAGKRMPGRTRKGPKWLSDYLHDAAQAAIRSKGTYLSAQYTRLKPKIGPRRALGAVEHSLLAAIYHMIDRDQPYQDLGADYFDRRNDPERQARRLMRDLTKLGYTVNITQAPAQQVQEAVA
jgi:hypothetical protein